MRVLKHEVEETKLRAVFASSPNAIAVTDLNGKTTECNQAALDMLGYSSKDEVIGKSVFVFITKKDRQRAMENLKKTLKQGSIRNVEYTFLTKDAHEISVELSASVIKDSSGNPTGFAVITKEFTERNLAKDALMESREKLRAQYKGIPIPMYTWQRIGEDFVLVDYNDASVAITHGNVANYVGKKASEMYRDRPKILEDLSRCFNEKTIIKREMLYRFMSTSESKYLEVSYAFVPPDLVVVPTEDITERKKAEQALKESEQKLRDIIDTSPDAIIWVDTTGKITLVNRKGFELTGFSEKDLIGKAFVDVEALTQESKEKILEAFMKRIEGIDTLPYEVEIITKNGEVIPAELSASPIFEGGKIVGTQSIFRDLRERKRAEEMLRESEEKYRTQFEEAMDAIFVADVETGIIIDCNRAASELVGREKSELVGKHQRILHPLQEIDGEYSKTFEQHVKGKEGQVLETQVINKEGASKEVAIKANVFELGGKKLLQGIFRDITKRKIMEEKLRQYSEHLEELVRKRTEELSESEKRYSVLVDEASDGVAMIQDGKVVIANKKAAEIIGYSIDEIIGLPFESVVDEKYLQLATEGYMRIMRGETVPPIAELELIAKTGERAPVEASSALVQYQGRLANLVIIRDIRERKRIEEERLNLEKLAAVGEVATMVGHDLRNPLQSIEIATYYLKNELPRLLPSIPISQKAVEMLQVINDSVNYADKIVKDLHDFSAAKKPILQKTNINGIVKETLSQVEMPENVELITELSHLPRISADKDMIKRVFLNLTVNGIQAMKNGGTLKVSTKKTEVSVEVSFKDTGIGIPKEDMRKIFIPFFTTKAKGIGMGLPICKRFVESHDGSIKVESEEGKGSTFTVKLPI